MKPLNRNDLAKKECTPCNPGTPAFSDSQVQEYLNILGNNWKITNGHLTKEYTFRNFREAMDFTFLLGEMAELQGHHPDIHLSWGRVGLELWTHVINGLTENDFILAAKADMLLEIPDTRPYNP